jgi:signal transduction histidine kinase
MNYRDLINQKDPRVQGFKILEIVMELFKKSLVWKIIEISKENYWRISSHEHREMIQEHFKFQMEIGWNVFVQIFSVVLWFAIPLSIYAFKDEPTQAIKFISSRILIFWLTYLLKRMNSTKYRINFMFENFLIFVWFFLSFVITFENMKYKKPLQYDLWLINQLMLFFLTFVYWFKWKRLILTFWMHRVLHLYLMCSKYGSDVLFVNILAQVVMMFLFPVICILIWKVVLDFLIEADKNKIMADSIKCILQMFPEAVVIRNKKETVFANNEAARELFEMDNMQVQVIDEKEQSSDVELNQLFDAQEQKLHQSWEEDDSCENIVISQYTSLAKLSKEEKFYTLKTVHVNWADSKNAFMHVFINTTDVQKLENAKAKNQWLHVLFSSLSHELRTPVNAFMNANQMIRYTSERIRETIVKKTQNKFNWANDVIGLIDRINKNTKVALISSNLLMNLTEDILDFAKIEAGIFTLSPKNFDVQELIEEITSIFEDQWMAKGVEFLIDCDERLLASQFNSDAGRIKQILINLISNSIKFTNRGSITVSLECLKERSFVQTTKYLKCFVEDTGIGISQEDKSWLFKVFGMVSKHKRDVNIRGTGLGLTIWEKLIKQLGGEISLESEENKGTKIIFTVKEAHSEDEPVFARSWQSDYDENSRANEVSLFLPDLYQSRGLHCLKNRHD